MTTWNTYNQNNNYTISSAEINESIGDSVFYGDMVTQGTLTITPDDGYVVSASDFSITGDLPTEIESVTFADLGTAGQEGNTIRVIATFANTFEVTQAYQIINLDIDGSATQYSPTIVPYNVIIEVGLPDFSDVVLNPNNNAISPFETDPFNNNNIIEYNIIGEAEAGVLLNIGQIQIDADDEYQIAEEPYFAYLNMPEDLITLNLVSMVNSSPQITSYTFDIMFRSDVEVKEDRSSKAILSYTVSAIPSVISRNNIISVIHGNSNISILGETRSITIYGDPGVEFDMTVTKDSDGSSILSTSNANTTILTPEYGSIDAINVKLPTGNGIKSFAFNQVFPTNDNILSTTIKTTRTNSTMSLNDSTANLKVGDQLVYDDITDTDNVTAIGNLTPIIIQSVTNASDVVLTGDRSYANPLAAALIQTSSDAVKFRRAEKYYINIYPKSNVTLGPSIPPALPNYTLTQHHKPLLTLTALLGTNYTLTTYSKITYLGKVGAKGSQLQTLAGVSGSTATAKNQKNLFRVTWVATASDPASHTFTTADNPVWSSTNVYDSSDSTSSDFDNDIVVNNGGTHIEIFNLDTSLNSTGTANTIATITFDVLIKEFGNRDVHINLPTSRFLVCA
jgi:hypothetical protein